MARRPRNQELLDRIATRLRGLREERNLSQRALAGAVDMEPESISRIESGTISLSITNLAEVARALGVTMADILDTEAAAPPPAQSPEVAELIRLYEGLDEGGRLATLGAIRGIAREWRDRPTTGPAPEASPATCDAGEPPQSRQ